MKFDSLSAYLVIGTFAVLFSACLTQGPKRQPTRAGGSAPITVPYATGKKSMPAAVPSTYFNNQYHFNGVVPEGFIVTHESDGPGEIMTLVPQSMSSNSTINLSVRASTLGKLSLKQYMDLRITREFQGNASVTHWDMFPATYGAYSGYEVLVERQYANGPFKARLFGFAQGPNVFIINYAASQDQFETNQRSLELLLETLKFTP
jgi:hypothetical protein